MSVQAAKASAGTRTQSAGACAEQSQSYHAHRAACARRVTSDACTSLPYPRQLFLHYGFRSISERPAELCLKFEVEVRVARCSFKGECRTIWAVIVFSRPCVLSNVFPFMSVVVVVRSTHTRTHAQCMHAVQCSSHTSSLLQVLARMPMSFHLYPVAHTLVDH